MFQPIEHIWREILFAICCQFTILLKWNSVSASNQGKTDRSKTVHYIGCVLLKILRAFNRVCIRRKSVICTQKFWVIVIYAYAPHMCTVSPKWISMLISGMNRVNAFPQQIDFLHIGHSTSCWCLLIWISLETNQIPISKRIWPFFCR